MEENQNVGMNVVNSPLMQRAKGFADFARSAREAKNQEAAQQVTSDMQRVFNYWLTTSDHWAAKECNKDIRIAQVADGINWNFFNWQRSIDVKNNARNFVNGWLANNMVGNQLNDYAQSAIDYIGDEKNIDCDPTEFYKAIWRWSSTIEEEVQPDTTTIMEEQPTEQGIEERAVTVEDVPDEVNDEDIDREFSRWENALWGVVETALWVPEMITKWGAYLGYLKNRAFKWNEWDQEIINKANLNKTLNSIDEFYEKLTPWDPESLTRMGTNLTTDLAVTAWMLMVPWMGEAKATELATKFPKLTKMLAKFKTLENLEKKAPRLAKFIRNVTKWSKLWAEIEVVNNSLDWELTSPKEAWEWMLMGILTEMWLNSKFAKKVSTFLETDWLMTKARMKNIINKIKDKVNKIPTSEDLANFMTKYWITGSREAMVQKAQNLYKSTMEVIDWIFSKVKWKFSSEATTQAINWLIKEMETNIAWGTPELGYREALEFLKSIQNKAGKYTATNMEKVKRLVDKYIEMFKKSWDFKTGYEWWVKVRQTLQKELENIGKSLWDVEALNNIVQTSYWIMKWVEDNLAWDGALTFASRYGLPSMLSIPLIKDIVKWDFSSMPVDLILPVVSWNTWLKTHLGSLMRRMSWVNRESVSKWLTSEGKEKLSKWASDELLAIINWDTKVKDVIKEYVVNLIKDTAIIWEQNAVEWLGNVKEKASKSVYTDVVK